MEALYCRAICDGLNSSRLFVVRRNFNVLRYDRSITTTPILSAAKKSKKPSRKPVHASQKPSAQEPPKKTTPEYKYITLYFHPGRCINADLHPDPHLKSLLPTSAPHLNDPRKAENQEEPTVSAITQSPSPSVASPFSVSPATSPTFMSFFPALPLAPLLPPQPNKPMSRVDTMTLPGILTRLWIGQRRR